MCARASRNECEQDEKNLARRKPRRALLHPERICEITQYILNNFRQKDPAAAAGRQGL